jgi:hypothetical protein
MTVVLHRYLRYALAYSDIAYERPWPDTVIQNLRHFDAILWPRCSIYNMETLAYGQWRSTSAKSTCVVLASPMGAYLGTY